MPNTLKYKPRYCEIVPEMFKNGSSVTEVSQLLGINRKTFYEWAKTYPDFAEAFEEGKINSEAWWMKLGREAATGKRPINPAIWIFNMKNRFKWRDKVDHEVSGKDGKPIETINTNMSAEEAAKLYAQEVLNDD